MKALFSLPVLILGLNCTMCVEALPPPPSLPLRETIHLAAVDHQTLSETRCEESIVNRRLASFCYLTTTCLNDSLTLKYNFFKIGWRPTYMPKANITNITNATLLSKYLKTQYIFYRHPPNKKVNPMLYLAEHY